jgi:phosphomannomutase/phosphoglucomutase
VLGEVDHGLDAAYAKRLGEAVGALAKDRGVARLAVARDGRLHGPVLLEAVVDGLRRSGLDVVQLGALPAPLMRFAAMELTDRSGLMVGGSLKPAHWNGLRAMFQGATVDGRLMLERLRDPGDGGAELSAGELVVESSIIARYIERISSQIQLERSLKVVVDCANGVCGLVVPRLLEAIGAEVIPLYADVDGQFPNHLPDPTRAEQLNDLRLCVRSFNADLGLAFDADGERMNLVAGDGRILWPERALILIAKNLLTRNPGAAVIHDGCCSPDLHHTVEAMGGRSIMTSAGPAVVESAMAEHSAGLGVTAEGHLFLASDHGQVRDVIHAACRILEVLAADTREITEIFSEFPEVFNHPAARLSAKGRDPAALLGEIARQDGMDYREEQGLVSFVSAQAWASLGLDENRTGLWFRAQGKDEHAVERVRKQIAEVLAAVDEELTLPVQGLQ